jgi:hypothetical protein
MTPDSGPGAGYRVRQLIRAVGEQRATLDPALVDRYLTEAARQAFWQMSPRDRTHSLRTAEAILNAGGYDDDLVVAALLHDAGKGEQRLWHRVAYVALAALSPVLLHRLARPGTGWPGALARSLAHAQAGADLARACGYADTVCALIAGHHRPAQDARQRALQRADEVA